MEFTSETREISVLEDLTLEYGSKELNALTYKIIGAALDVYNEMGKGFSEIVYKDCLSIEFERRKIEFKRERKYELSYKGVQLSRHYFADFLIEDKVIVEVKSIQGIISAHSKQVINYLAASKCQIGLILNFGEDSLVTKRVILTK